MSQAQSILKALQLGQKLTPLSALRKFGSLNLRNRIGELRKDGHRIEQKMIAVNGKHFLQYWI